MNKEKLIEKMREAALLQNVHEYNHKDVSVIDHVFDKYGSACAEAALKELDNEWVRTYENMRGDMIHRKTLYIWCKEFSYVFKGYYDCIIGVFKSDNNPIFDGHFHNVTHYQYEDLPTPPKQ